MVTEPKLSDGEWQFPETWPAEARASWVSMQKTLDDARAARGRAEAERVEALASPELALLTLRTKADAERAAAERAQVEAADERAILTLRAKYGERLATIYTAAGSLVLVWTRGHERLWALVKARAENVATALLEASPPDPVRAESESLKAINEGYFEHVIVHPAKEKAREALELYPEAWAEVYRARTELARGPRAAAGKGVGH